MAGENPNEAGSVLGTARGTIALFSGTFDYTPTIIQDVKSMTTSSSVTSATRSESIEYIFQINSSNGVARGNTSTIDWGGLAVQAPITYQIVEG